MTSIEDRLRQLRENANQAQARKARTDADLEAATANLQTAKALLADFGVASITAANEKLDSLNAELETMIADLETQLSQAG